MMVQWWCCCWFIGGGIVVVFFVGVFVILLILNVVGGFVVFMVDGWSMFGGLVVDILLLLLECSVEFVFGVQLGDLVIVEFGDVVLFGVVVVEGDWEIIVMVQVMVQVKSILDVVVQIFDLVLEYGGYVESMEVGKVFGVEGESDVVLVFVDFGYGFIII